VISTMICSAVKAQPLPSSQCPHAQDIPLPIGQAGSTKGQVQPADGAFLRGSRGVSPMGQPSYDPRTLCSAPSSASPSGHNQAGQSTFWMSPPSERIRAVPPPTHPSSVLGPCTFRLTRASTYAARAPLSIQDHSCDAIGCTRTVLDGSSAHAIPHSFRPWLCRAGNFSPVAIDATTAIDDSPPENFLLTPIRVRFGPSCTA